MKIKDYSPLVGVFHVIDSMIDAELEAPAITSAIQETFELSVYQSVDLYKLWEESNNALLSIKIK